MKIERLDEYRVSHRVTLRRGDKFRVGGGPYWRMADGTKHSLATRGVVTFVAAVRRGRCIWIEAIAKDGFCVLHIEGRRRRVDPSLVPRPYTIKSRLRSAGVKHDETQRIASNKRARAHSRDDRRRSAARPLGE